MQKKVQTFRNCPNWLPNDHDYQLFFVEVDGVWRELGHDMPKYANCILSDYLAIMNLYNIPDYTQFLRIIHPDYYLEFRHYGGCIRIDYHEREFISKLG